MSRGLAALALLLPLCAQAQWATPFVKTGDRTFEARAPRHAITAEPGGVRWSLRGERAAAAITWSFQNASAPKPEDALAAPVRQQLSGGQWSTATAHAKLTYAAVAPGVDVWIAPERAGLRYEATVAAGAQVSAVRFRYGGVLALALADGGLRIDTAAGALNERGLRCYQTVEGAQRDVPCRYGEVRRERAGEWSYAVLIGAHDARLPVVVDPVTTWSYALGGAGSDVANGVAALCDSYFIGGALQSAGFQQGSPDAGTYNAFKDGFVARLYGDGGIAWLTYLSGDTDDEVTSVSVGPQGQVLAGGNTNSQDFLGDGTTESGAARYDGFVAQLNAEGGVEWSTRLASDGGVDSVSRVLFTPDGYRYFSGSSSAPGMGGAAAAEYGGGKDAVAGLLNANGTRNWITYVNAPGTSDEEGLGLAYGGAAGVFIGGTTTHAPGWTGSYYYPIGTAVGSPTLLVTKLDRASGVVQFRYQVQSADALVFGALVYFNSYVYAGGPADPSYFGITGKLQQNSSYAGGKDMAIVRVPLDGGQALAAAFGSTGADDLKDLVATQSAVLAIGRAGSTSFPAGGTQNLTASGGQGDVLVQRITLDQQGATLTHVWTEGGSGDDYAVAGAVGSSGLVFAGQSASTEVPGHFNESGGRDIYVGAIPLTDLPAFNPPPAFCDVFEGRVVPDAGTDGGEEDAGVDAGAEEDAGQQTDAGAQSRTDAGHGQDAGGGGPDEPVTRPAYGWSCGATGAAPWLLALVAIAALLVRRRRA